MTQMQIEAFVRHRDNRKWVVLSVPMNPETDHMDIETLAVMFHFLVGLCSVGPDRRPTKRQYRSFLEQALTYHEVEGD